MYISQYELQEDRGNNAHAFNERKIIQGKNPSLIIPSLKKIDSHKEIILGKHIVFEDLDQNHTLQSCTGLAHLYQLEKQNIYIMDNHNHALYFWLEHINTQWNQNRNKREVIHIDAHADLGTNKNHLDTSKIGDKSYTWDFTNLQCQIGNFIPPFVEATWIQCQQVRSSSKLLSTTLVDSKQTILDIDLDFRALEKQIPREELSKVRELITSASLVTIATSPFFLDQDRALHFLEQILS